MYFIKCLAFTGHHLDHILVVLKIATEITAKASSSNDHLYENYLILNKFSQLAL